MELKDVYQLWERFDASAVTELNLELHDLKLTLKKGTAATGFQPAPQPVFQTPQPVFNPMVVNNNADGKVERNSGTAEKSAETKPAAEEVPAVLVKAPLVGTFYRSPAPGEAPFAAVGQKVKKGDVVGIIEAMKLMNEITAPQDGEVTEILVEDGDMVEFDQVLMKLQ